MWIWDYEEEGTNIRDGVRGTVIVDAARVYSLP